MLRKFIILTLFRDSILDTLNISKQDFIYLLTSRITNYTNYNNIINALNYLKEQNIITGNITIQIHTLFITKRMTDYQNTYATDNYSNQNIYNIYDGYRFLNTVFNYKENSILYTSIYVLPTYFSNKNKLLRIITDFNQNLQINTIETYDIIKHLYEPMTFNNGIFYTYITYNEIFAIINRAIKQYFLIYLIRSKTISYTSLDLNRIITLFDNPSFDVTDNIMLIYNIYQNYSIYDPSLYKFVFNNLYTDTYNILISLIIKLTPISTYSEIIQLPPDPTPPDNYYVKDALSYYRGTQLLNDIKYRIAKNDTNIFKVSSFFFLNGVVGSTAIPDLKFCDRFLTQNDLITNHNLSISSLQTVIAIVHHYQPYHQYFIINNYKAIFEKSIVAHLNFSCHVDSSDDPEFVRNFL
jgi:hypothetical protein